MQRAETGVRVVIAARAVLRQTMHQAVTAAGMHVAATCSNTAELIAAVSREHPDVCVLDRELRGGGLTATAAITSPRRAPKVLVIGGRGSAAELRAIRLAGATASLPGDVDAAGLTAAIAALTRKEQP